MEPTCDIPGAVYLGPLPSRGTLRREGSPHRPPEGYEVLEVGKHVWAVPAGHWHDYCEGSGCRDCGWTGEAAKVKRPCKRCISFGHATNTCWRSARRSKRKDPHDTCYHWVEDPTPRRDR